MARRTASSPRAAPRARLAGEIGAIALVVFALLTVVALLAAQGALLLWWRSLLLGLLGWGAVAAPLALVAAAAATLYA
ncbi:MAG: hypothetical protein ACRDF0_06140, partial [Candidatus Limnocylindria bacterium]